jgi:hypothetical protein
VPVLYATDPLENVPPHMELIAILAVCPAVFELLDAVKTTPDTVTEAADMYCPLEGRVLPKR